MWQLSGNNDLPLYQQIIKLIEDQIRQGLLLPGEKLPPERKLAMQLGVNRSTVVHAFDELAERGVLIRKQGSGTVINQEKWGVTPAQKTNWRHYVDQSGFLPASPYIRRTHDLIKHRPDDLLDLATGELPLELTPEITMPAFSWQDLLAEEKHEDIAGYRPLKKTIQQRLLKEQHIHATPEQILITSGAQQALFIITQCLLRPGDAIAIESPSYFYALPLFQSAGLRILALPMDNQGIQPDELERLSHKYSIKMVFLNPTFQNPTGLVMPQKRREQIIAVCARLNLPIVEDNSYGQLQFDAVLLPPTLKQLDEQNVLHIGSLSKITGSMTRIGWLVGPAAVIRRLAEARQEMDFGLSIFPQVLANHVIRNSAFDRHLASLRTILRQRRDILISAIEKHLPQRLHYQMPTGGFHLWCRLPQNQPLYKIVETLLEHHVLVMPANVFGSKEPAVRLTFARLQPEEAERAAVHLANVLDFFETGNQHLP